MNSDLMTGAECYGLFEGNEQIGFLAGTSYAAPA